MNQQRSVGVGLSCILVMSSLGCRANEFSQTFWNPFGLESSFAPQKEPVRIGVTGDASRLWNVRAWWDLDERTPWTEFRRALGRHLNRPIQVEQLKPFQVGLQLESGRLDFALLDDDQYDEVTGEVEGCRVIARAQANDNVGLIVASAKSDIERIEQVSGHRFSFGPRGDPVLHFGAAAALDEAGVSIDDIQRELIPVATLQYHLNAMESAKEIVHGLTPAGVILESDYNGFAESGGTLIPMKLSKDQFRVLGRTSSIDLGPFLAGPSTDDELVADVRSFLVNSATETPAVTNALGIASFVGVE